MSNWSLQKKMIWLLMVFAVIPLCVMAGLMISMSWNAHVSEKLKRDEFAFENIAADAQMLASQTEGVVRAFADSDAVKDMLSQSTRASWTASFNSEVRQEATRAELYLSSLDANIMLIFDGPPGMERWYTLLDVERFSEDAGYLAYLQSGKNAVWYGIGDVMPTSLANIYDYRGIGKKLLYYCGVYSRFNRKAGVIKCAIDARSLISSAHLRLGSDALYIRSNGQIFYASDGVPIPGADQWAGANLLWQDGYIWQRCAIAGLGLEIVARSERADLVKDYLATNGGMLFLVILAIFLLFFVSRRVLNNLLARLNRIASAADNINAKDGRVHLPDEGEDEAGHVVRAFNRLFDRLDRQMEETMRKERAERRMQALALQYQLNPHFLFNSLLWLQMELEDREVDPKISASITKLGSVLRYNLSESLESTLLQEAEHLQAYIDFMCNMKKQVILLKLEWDPELNALSIPRFMLQPVVENALHHGLLRGIDMEIRVHVERTGKRLRFEIANNGKAIEETRLRQIREDLSHPDTQAKTGLGLGNLVRRLALKYGEDYRVEVTSDIHRTAFVIEIPAQTAAREEDAS